MSYQKAHKNPYSFALVLLCFVFILMALGPIKQPIFGDEIPLIENLINFYQFKTILPTMYNYPTLYSYVAFVVFGFMALIERAVTGLNFAEIGFFLDWPIYGTAKVSTEIIALRIFSMLLGVLLIVTTYILGRVTCNQSVGLIAAGLLTFTHTFIYRSTLILPDVLTALLCAVALALGALVLKNHNKPMYSILGVPVFLLAAAVFSGMAVASKYNAALVFSYVCIVLVVWRVQTGEVNPKIIIRDLVLIVSVFLMAFLFANPALLLVPQEYWTGFEYERDHVMAGQLYIDWGEYPFLWLPMRLVQVEGIVGVIFILGAVRAFFKCRHNLRLLFVPVGLMVVAIGGWKYTSIHYLMWCFPILAIGGAVLLSEITNKVCPNKPYVFAVLGLICILPNSFDLAQNSLLWWRGNSNQLLAERWVEENIKSGERVSHNWYGVPSIWSEQTRKQYIKRISSRADISEMMKRFIFKKPIYSGYLGFQTFPPSANQLESENPTWVLDNSELEPPTSKPLAGYGSRELIDLHALLAGYYEFLTNGGKYRLAREFSKGPGSSIRLYRRID